MAVSSPDFAAAFQSLLRPTPDTLKLRGEFSAGSFGPVQKGDYNGQVVSVKKIGDAFLHLLHQKGREEEGATIVRETVDAFKKELRNIKASAYPYIVEVLGAFYDSALREPLLVAEELQKDLSTYLTHCKGRLKQAEQVVISLQVVTGLRYLQLTQPNGGRSSFWHLLNDRNLFLAYRGVVKIFHFGLGLRGKLDQKMLSPDLTPYLPPEALHEDIDFVFSEKADVFAMGVLMLEIATQRRPLADHGPSSASVPLEKQRRVDLDLLLESHPLKTAILSCLKDEPLERPSVIELHQQLSLVAEGEKSEFRSDLITSANQQLFASSLQDAPIPNAFGSGILIDGKVYVGGVRCHDAESSRLVHTFSLHSLSWSSLSPAPLLYSQLVGIDGCVTLIGGCDVSTWKVTDKTATCDAANEKWVETLPRMPVKRVRPGVTSSDGLVVVAGGLAEDMKHTLDTVDVFDVRHRQWSSVAPLCLPRSMSCPNLVRCGDLVYLLGGMDAEKVAIADMWVMSWSELVPDRERSKGRGKGKAGAAWMSKGKTLVTNASYFSSGSIPICVGGSDLESKRPSNAIQLFNTATSQWTKGGALGVSRAHPCVVPISSTAFIVVGGCKSARHMDDSMVATAEYMFL